MNKIQKIKKIRSIFYNRLFIDYILLAVIYIISFFAVNFTSLHQSYKDEDIYIHCGERYLQGVCPLFCNPEHPPLAKLVYGIFSLAGFNVHIFLFILGIINILILYKIILQLTRNREISMLVGLIIASDALVLNVVYSALLDNIMLTFFLASLYFFIVKRDQIMAGLLSSLSILSKLSIAQVYISYILLYIKYKLKKVNIDKLFTKYFLFSILFLFIIFHILYFTCIKNEGYVGVLEKLYQEINYHAYVHHPNVRISFISFSKMFTGIEIWKNYIVKFQYINGSLVATNVHHEGYLVEFRYGEYSPHIIVGIIIIIYVYFARRTNLLIHRVEEEFVDLIKLMTLMAAFMFIYDPIPWYYIPFHYLFTIYLGLLLDQKYLRLLFLLNILYIIIGALLLSNGTIVISGRLV